VGSVLPPRTCDEHEQEESRGDGARQEEALGAQLEENAAERRAERGGGAGHDLHARHRGLEVGLPAGARDGCETRRLGERRTEATERAARHQPHGLRSQRCG